MHVNLKEKNLFTELMHVNLKEGNLFTELMHVNLKTEPARSHPSVLAINGLDFKHIYFSLKKFV